MARVMGYGKIYIGLGPLEKVVGLGMVEPKGPLVGGMALAALARAGERLLGRWTQVDPVSVLTKSALLGWIPCSEGAHWPCS